MTSLISCLPLKLYVDLLVSDQKHLWIFLQSLSISNRWLSAYIVSLQHSPDIFRKCSVIHYFVWPLDNFWRIFGNLSKIAGNFWKMAKKCRYQHVYFINKNSMWLLVDMEYLILLFNFTSHLFAALTCEISWTL